MNALSILDAAHTRILIDERVVVGNTGAGLVQVLGNALPLTVIVRVDPVVEQLLLVIEHTLTILPRYAAKRWHRLRHADRESEVRLIANAQHKALLLDIGRCNGIMEEDLQNV